MNNKRDDTSFVKTINDKQIVSLQFRNYGVVFGKLSKQIYDELYSESLKIRKEDKEEMDYRSKLAGNLKHEYDLTHKCSLVEPVILNMIGLYDREYNFLKEVTPNIKNSNLVLSSLWVNFMEKHDFNPIHNHTGVFSFVIWMKIPYDLEEELNQYPKSNAKSASTFSFHFTNILGEVSLFTIDVDKDYEGVICLFPSKLTHSVNPFYKSDESRISISGNVHFDNSGVQ